MPPESELHCLCNSITVPYLLNFNLIWGGEADIHLNKLLISQKRALRIIPHSECFTYNEVLLQQLSILKISEIYKYSCCMHDFNYKKMYEINRNK